MKRRLKQHPSHVRIRLKPLACSVEDPRNLFERRAGRTVVIQGNAIDDGVAVDFNAHDELLDDLIRRFEEWVDRG